MMPVEPSQTWDVVIADLVRLDLAGAVHVASLVSTPSPVVQAIEFVVLLRDQAAPAPQRVSSCLPDRVHLEWFGPGATVVVALDGTDEGEIMSYMNGDGFASQYLRWRSGHAERLPVPVDPLGDEFLSASVASYYYYGGE